MRGCARLCGAWLCACLAASARANESARLDPARLSELSLEQLMDLRVETVYGASRFEQKLTEAPASVSVVGADEIKRLGYRTLGEVLRSMRGLYVADDRNYSYLGVRGFLRPGDYNTRVLVLIDGHRMNDDVYDSAYVGRDMLSVDLIERVEFIRGPSSSIYGASAFFGVINIVTRGAAQLEGLRASASAGSFGSYANTLRYGRRFGGGNEILLFGSRYHSSGQRRLYYPEFDQRIGGNPRARHDGIAHDADSEDVSSGYFALKLAGLKLAGFMNSRSKHVPTASFGTVFDDNRERTLDQRAYLDARYDWQLGPALALQGRAFYDRYVYYGDYPTDYAAPGAPPDVVLNRDETLGEWFGSEWQMSGTLFQRHRLLAGVEYRENLHARQRNYDNVEPRTYYLDDDRRSSIWSVYVQGDFALMPSLKLNAGLRYDDYPQSFGGTLNPRLALIYNPWDATVLKALYGRAYRAPNAYERFYYPAQRQRPALKPETIQTYELVLEQALGRHHRLALSAYHYDVEQLISQRATGAGDIYFDNLDRASAHGVELEAESRLDNGVQARVSYALQSAHDGSGAPLGNSPRHLAKASLIAPLLPGRLFAGLELQYHGPVRTLSGAQAGGFTLANLTFSSARLWNGLEVAASAYNLFDKRYAYPGAQDHAQDAIGQDGLSFRIKFTQSFGP